MSATVGSFRSQWASRLVREKLFHELHKIKAKADHQPPQHGSFVTSQAVGLPFMPPILGNILDQPPADPYDLPKDYPQEHYQGSQDRPVHDGFDNIVPEEPGEEHGEKHRICIVGAGVTGLFIAMILDSLNIPGLEYDILEASNRTGGRMYTHHFSDVPHDYYDIGAMRFPKIDIMKTTFKLFEQLQIPLIPYFLEHKLDKFGAKGSVKCPTMYNDITVIDGEEPRTDPFRVSQTNGGSVPDGTVDEVNKLLKKSFGPFKEEMAKDFETGFKILKKYDSYSTREFLKNPPPPEKCWKPWEPLDFFTIQWLETNNTSSGLFDQAFSESVIDSFDFDAPEVNKVEEWFCIDGGTSLVAKAMERSIQQPIQHGKRVNKFFQVPDTKEISVSVVGEPEGSRSPYTTVFNTTSLACLQRIDLTGLNLHPSQKDAIRALHYDDSAKVAMKFSYPWWITRCGIKSGGIASTDSPLRTCVYPSYNIHDPQDKPAILMCSYTWAQDATRIGSLISRTNGQGSGSAFSNDHDVELRDMMLDNLARLHLKNFQQHKSPAASSAADTSPITLAEVRKIIGEAFISQHAFSWSHDPFTSGAFALFGPGQFANLYPYLSRPTADSRFHICGEASSAHHAWIVGSLDSALASVHRFLRRFEMWDAKEKLKGLWDTPEEVEDDVHGTVHLQVLLGRLPQKEMVQV